MNAILRAPQRFEPGDEMHAPVVLKPLRGRRGSDFFLVVPESVSRRGEITP
jgi:glutathione synthase/RimK-type ligase-like ATP-grasp enzyme